VTAARAVTRRLAAPSGLAVLALLMLVCGVASMVMGADRGWDAQNYHVYAPWRLFVDRPHDRLAAGMQGFHNPLPDIPFALLLWKLNDWPRLVAFLMGLPAGAALWVAWRCARHLLADAPRAELLALLAAIGTAGGSVFRSQVGTTSGDVVTGGLVLLGVLALLRPAAAPWRAAGLAGLACGAAIGLKLTNAPFAPALAAMVVVRLGLDRRLPGALLACALGGVAGIVATGGWWAAHLAAQTGNPLFPYFNELFDAGEGIPRAGRDLQFMPATLTEALIRPFLWAVSDLPRVTEERMRDPRLAAGLLAALVLPFLRGAPARRAALPVAVFLLVAYAIWLPLFSIYRYAFVLEALAPALLIAALTALPARVATGAAAVAVLAAFPLTKPVPALRAPLDGGGYLAVEWPALAPGATVLGTAKPTAFLAVGLPPGIGLWSLAGLAEMGGPADRAALAALREGSAPLYAVLPGDGQGIALLAPQGLSPMMEGCRRICTNWSPAGAGPMVCPLTRDGRGEAPPALRHDGPARHLCEAAGPGLISAGRRGLRVAGEALLDFGAGCREATLTTGGGDRPDATPPAEPAPGGGFRVTPPPDGVVRLRGETVLTGGRCVVW
jgi:hypothetical protein